MKKTRQEAGRLGEEEACSYLLNQGFFVLARNWHAGRYGEIDIIVQKGQELFVVEVKTKQEPFLIRPEIMVDESKVAKLKLAAQAFVLAHPQLPQQVSLLVVAVVLSASNFVKDIKIFTI
ncbi:YraN family protein [Patescibacteria group bacterium]|nr:YraN family protein [Patescibacteria group bacterium]